MKMIRHSFVWTALLLVAAPSLAAEIESVAVYPTTITLTTQRDHQSVVVQARYKDGTTRDVTAESKLTVDDASLVRLAGAAVHPTKDGKTTLRIEHAGRKLDVPVTIAKAAADRPISFRLDVMPVFTKSGCNTGACHGSSRGKDGYHMSLFGYDPGGDWYRLTHEQIGRRINLALPAESLIVTKATGKVPHTGGELFSNSSPRYKTILRWLDAGAPNDAADVATVTSLEVYPPNMVLNGPGAAQQMLAIAHYSDGTTRDVTSLAKFITNNDRSADVDEAGRVKAGVRGEAFIMARFDAFTVGSQAIVLPKDAKYDWPNVPENNYIDTLIHNKLKKLRMKPAPLCTDEVFIRRVYLDVVGLLPTPEQSAAFLADKSPDKRDKLVDELLGRKEFVEMWVMKFAELLQIRSGRLANGNQIPYKTTVLYHGWLQEQFTNNVPMDQVVSELLGASGGTFTNPATNFYQIENDQKKMAENIAQVFMGMRIQCAQCHNHPFDRWTTDDYYGFVSFFTQVGKKRGEDPREQIVYNRGSGEINHLVYKKPMPPKFLGGAVADVKGKDRRKVAAEWIASPQNPYFAPNLANIVWSHFFGRGIVEPVDDVRVSNPASNPELLAELGKRFTDYKYDFKKIVRDIVTSRTYQLSTQVNETNQLDHANFSRAYVRRVRSEVLFDIISQVTETTHLNKFKGLPQGARAVQIADGNTSTYFLKAFGRSTRDSVCSCEVQLEPNLSQALHLLNGPTTQGKIGQGKVVVNALKEQKLDVPSIVEQLYLRCVSRRPTADERTRIIQQINATENKQQALEDLFWALLNSKEFSFNH